LAIIFSINITYKLDQFAMQQTPWSVVQRNFSCFIPWPEQPDAIIASYFHPENKGRDSDANADHDSIRKEAR